MKHKYVDGIQCLKCEKVDINNTFSNYCQGCHTIIQQVQEPNCPVTENGRKVFVKVTYIGPFKFKKIISYKKKGDE